MVITTTKNEKEKHNTMDMFSRGDRYTAVAVCRGLIVPFSLCQKIKEKKNYLEKKK